MKYIPYFIVVLLLYTFISSILKENNIISEDAIRVRVIANSNTIYDQEIKMIVKEEVTDEMYKLLKDVKGIEEARSVINSNLNSLDNNISTLLKNNNYNLGYDINFGYNYFPKKVYKGIEYKDGYYESLVVTLGKGEGDNWWCILFPPVCMIEATDSDDLEYTTLVEDLFSKYL